MGDTIAAEFAQSGEHSLRIAAIYPAKGWISADLVLSRTAQEALAGPQLVTNALVTVAQGADLDEGIKSISIPVVQIAVYVAVAAIAGVLAAVGPARVAAQVDVLRAVVTD